MTRLLSIRTGLSIVSLLIVFVLLSQTLMGNFAYGLAGDSDVTERSWQMIGTGYKPGTQEVLFYEYHNFILDDDGYIVNRYVEYHLPDHTLKSVKRLDYSKAAPWTPSFTYDDQEVGYQVGVEVTATSARLYRYSEKTSLEEITLPLSTNTVVDAGFDAFIQQAWAKLEQDQEVSFEVFAPLKLDSYQFSLKMNNQSEGTCYLQMALDWWPVDLFISPVKLEYDCATRRILRYQGITNLRDRNHDQYTADIHYQWMGEYPPFRFASE